MHRWVVGLGLPSISLCGGRRGNRGVSFMRRTEIAVGQRRGLRQQVLSSPTPRGGQVARITGVKDTCGMANGPGAAIFPRLDPARIARGIFPDPATRRRSDMGGASAAGPIAYFCALGHVSLLASFVCPRARSRYSHHIVPVLFTSIKGHLRRRPSTSASADW